MVDLPFLTCLLKKEATVPFAGAFCLELTYREKMIRPLLLVQGHTHTHTHTHTQMNARTFFDSVAFDFFSVFIFTAAEVGGASPPVGVVSTVGSGAYTES